jgi:hypothetical protein
MKMKTIYEKPEAQLRPSVIRCSILAGSLGQTTGENSGNDEGTGTGTGGTNSYPKDPDDARRRSALYF